MTDSIRTVRVPGEALAHLSAADPVMAALVERIGAFEYPVDPDLWRAVVGSIVGQQLSVAAAATIRGRIAALGSNGYPSPAEIHALPDDTLRACGLSRAKVTYVRGAALAWLEGRISPETLAEAPDEDVIEALSLLRGVGRWTAEMVLIFSLNRPDVLAVDDLGIRVAVQRAYGLSDRPAKQELERIAADWRPYRSYASRYLWRSLKE